jgi:hypothetical protein
MTRRDYRILRHRHKDLHLHRWGSLGEDGKDRVRRTSKEEFHAMLLSSALSGEMPTALQWFVYQPKYDLAAPQLKWTPYRG